MNLIEVSRLYDMNRKQLLLNLTNIPKYATKNVEKRKKKIIKIFSYKNVLESSTKQKSFIIKKISV
jgi:hypothetical protein